MQVKKIKLLSELFINKIFEKTFVIFVLNKSLGGTQNYTSIKNHIYSRLVNNECIQRTI